MRLALNGEWCVFMNSLCHFREVTLRMLKAPGEAEAELAYLNRLGVIDAVLSDDVDTFLFGATMVVRK